MEVILAVISVFVAEVSMCAFCFVQKKETELEHQHRQLSLN